MVVIYLNMAIFLIMQSEEAGLLFFVYSFE